jgi:predicted component of type VI protein secretion system
MAPPIVPQPAAPWSSPKPAGGRPVLATLEVINEGPTKGTRFDIVSPLTHVGRGPHNDVVIADDSVSDSHAKIQRREDGWVVVDMDSTNGTYVGGDRVEIDAPLGATVDLRFGGVKMLFKTAASPREGGSGTRVVVGYRPKTPLMTDAVPAEAETPADAATPSSRGLPRFLLAMVIILALAVVYLISQSL